MKVELNEDEVFILRQYLLDAINEQNEFAERNGCMDIGIQRACDHYVTRLRIIFDKLGRKENGNG